MTRLSIIMSAFILLMSAETAFAYLDAGTGAMVLQLLLGGVAGFLVVFKLYWTRIKSILGLKQKDSDESEA